MSNNPSYSVPVHLRQITDNTAFDYKILSINDHAFFSLCLPHPVAVIVVAAVFTSTVPPVPTTGLLAKVVPSFEFVALSTVPSQIFICYFVPFLISTSTSKPRAFVMSNNLWTLTPFSLPFKMLLTWVTATPTNSPSLALSHPPRLQLALHGCGHPLL